MYAGQAAAQRLVPETISVPAGVFTAGSNQAEREAAYRLDEAAYGHDATRRNRWYDSESPRTKLYTGAFVITRNPITNAQYWNFAAATGRSVPDVDRTTWNGYRLVHPYSQTRRHAWLGGRIPKGRENHPVVLVSYGDARAYATWLSRMTGMLWRLPTEREWEKAVRGTEGRRFPWGDAYDPFRLNSADKGPFDTVPVGSYPAGAGPFGLLDGAGQVFEWTTTLAGRGRFVVKGGSWDDEGCGVCRSAARHSRPAHLKHILIGFRLVRPGGSR